MREIYRNDHFIVNIDDERRVVYRIRTERPFATLAEAGVAYEAALEPLDAIINRPVYGLLVDARLAPPRNDPAFEQFVSQYYGRLYSGFRRLAAVVKTQAGRLQLARMSQSHGFDLRVFVDEQAALAYLTAADAAARSPSTPPSAGLARPPSRRAP